MKKITVSQSGAGDFLTLNSAIAAFDTEEPLDIFVCNGLYREKLFCSRAFTWIVGESRDGTVIEWGDGALHTHADGRKNGTFRSYTLWLGGGRAEVETITIVNSCGGGAVAGQGIAAAVDAGEVFMRNVALRGFQDTLYTGPLPPCERLHNGFLGPGQNSERLPSRQHYIDCQIEGNIDFIFGGADALFEDCRILCRGGETVGYIAAPSTPRGGLGYLFLHCTVEGVGRDSFYLARPWREYGRAVFADCRLDAVIKPDGWDNWGDRANEATCYFAEYKNSGAGAGAHRAFGKVLTAGELELLLSQFRSSVPRGTPRIWQGAYRR